MRIRMKIHSLCHQKEEFLFLFMIKKILYLFRVVSKLYFDTVHGLAKQLSIIV